MVSRRTTLRMGGTALVGALAGCAGGDDGPDASDRTSTGGSTTAGSAPTRTTPGEPTLTAKSVAASAVPSGATAAVASSDLYALVEEAASADGRVDLVTDGSASSDDLLALGAFDYLRFRDETYRPAASYARFAGEASYQYSATPVAESEVEGEAVSYADLSEAEREIGATLLAGETYDVGHHEERPDAATVFDAHDYLRTENATYRIRVLVGDAAAHHMLRLDPADPGADAQVVTVADDPVPSAVRGTVTEAVADGSAAVSNPDELGAFLDGVGFVVTRHAVADLRAELG